MTYNEFQDRLLMKLKYNEPLTLFEVLVLMNLITAMKKAIDNNKGLKI